MPDRPVASGGAGGARAPPLFGRSVNPISNQGGHIIPTQYYVPPPDFQTLRRPCCIHFFQHKWILSGQPTYMTQKAHTFEAW